MEQITALDFKIKEMAARIRELREIQNLTTVQMAEKTGVSDYVMKNLNTENSHVYKINNFVAICARGAIGVKKAIKSGKNYV